ncbi:MAG: HDOD domain-containing protein [Solirubrobacterales bacterium]
MGKGGHRLSAAFEAVNTFPALSEAVDRLLKLTNSEGTSSGDIADAVELDTAIAIAVMRAANNGGAPKGGVPTLIEAVDALTPAGVRAVAGQLNTYEPFGAVGNWSRVPERFRRHAVATRHAAEKIAELGDVGSAEEISTAATLHDVGQLVLLRLHPEYPRIHDDRGVTPEERNQTERRDLGIDHTLVGGVLARRWGLPSAVASAIERHHSDSAEGVAAAVRLADMIVHHSIGDAVDADAMMGMGAECGLSRERLMQIVYEFPHSGTPKQRRAEPCPLSKRELDALRGLAEGRVYKEIAADMSLSASTVRTHLHNVYRKIGAADRAQAVLVARERGWV